MATPPKLDYPRSSVCKQLLVFAAVALYAMPAHAQAIEWTYCDVRYEAGSQYYWHHTAVFACEVENAEKTDRAWEKYARGSVSGRIFAVYCGPRSLHASTARAQLVKNRLKLPGVQVKWRPNTCGAAAAQAEADEAANPTHSSWQDEQWGWCTLIEKDTHRFLITNPDKCHDRQWENIETRGRKLLTNYFYVGCSTFESQADARKRLNDWRRPAEKEGKIVASYGPMPCDFAD